jgi:hypothetical protein
VSEVITLTTGESETIHGTFAAAKAYIAMMYGDTYDAWTALSTDDKKKRTLAAAVRYLNAQAWSDDYDTFAERDAVTAFATAQYELAAMIANDASVMSAIDAGSNIQSVSAGSASVSYFAPTSAGKGATKLPTIVHRLIGSYLAASSASSVTAYGATGNEDNPFNDDSDYDRGEPY